jgi:hypothetical protein
MGAGVYGTIGRIYNDNGTETDIDQDRYGSLVITQAMSLDAIECGRKVALGATRRYIAAYHHYPTKSTTYDLHAARVFFSKEARKRYTNRRFLEWFVTTALGALDSAMEDSITQGMGAFNADEL